MLDLLLQSVKKLCGVLQRTAPHHRHPLQETRHTRTRRSPRPRKQTPGQQIGRTRTKDNGNPPKQFKRVAITYHHKRDVVEFYDAIVSKELKIHFYDDNVKGSDDLNRR
ncbi:hypothetical protein F442_12367 [Phytophthora nicotianae P10297]|uniref:Uncharacterized protein n=1 Tax=Phytophthora nicotianae P10297 TaxID=1317064 RepID=W2YZ29_PHYNI|nr:hypothetical protein F442_12367 [Phytophthora nicotianae P10297]